MSTDLIPSLTEVDELSNVDDAKYLRKKITGGGSSRKGFVFEQRYIAFRMSEAALFAKSKRIRLSDVRFGVQVLSYIDDFVLDCAGNITWYEIKSGDRVIWDEGPNTIAENFLSQMLLDRGRSVAATYNLVVSTRTHEDNLQNSRDCRTDHVGIVVFPNSSYVDDIELEYSWFPHGLSKLIPLDATRRDYEDFFEGLQAIAINFPNNEIRDLAFVSERLSVKYKGAFTCLHDMKLDPRAEDVILAVPGMSVVVCGDQVHYRCSKPTVRGHVSGCCIGRKSGDEFEEMIMSVRPTNWEQLAPILWRDYGAF